MHFKVVYNYFIDSLDINCLPDNNSDIILPENTDQHVYFPIPSDLKNKIKSEMNKIIPKEKSDEFSNLVKDIHILEKMRKEKISEIRKNINPEIIKVCKQFREDNAEEFI